MKRLSVYEIPYGSITKCWFLKELRSNHTYVMKNPKQTAYHTVEVKPIDIVRYQIILKGRLYGWFKDNTRD